MTKVEEAVGESFSEVTHLFQNSKTVENVIYIYMHHTCHINA